MKEVKLQKYPAYKDSGVEWLGEIPEHWEVKKITHIFNTIGSGTTPTAGTAKYYDDGIINFLQTGDLTDGLIRATSKRITTKAISDFSSLKIYPKESLVVAMYGATIGKVGYLDIESTTNQACCVLGVPNDFFTKYGFYWFIGAKSTIISMSYGGGQPNISQDLIKSLRVSVPPIEEQTAIANFLDNKTALIDKAIALKEKQIELLKERRQILIHRAVTRGLNPDVKLKDSGVEWIGEIPEHWEVKKIKNLGKIVNGFAFNSTDFKSAGVRVMKIANIQTMKVDWSDESFVDQKYFNQYPQFQIKRNDLVFALTRPIISTGIKATIVDSDEPILLNQRNAVLKPCNELNKLWIYYIILNSQFVQAFDNQIDKTGQQPNISTYNIGNLEIPLPSLEEQILISEFLEKTSQKISTAITLKEKEIEKLKEYKSVLINEAVSGKIKVG